MSPALDHDAIRKAYPNAVRVSDSRNGAWDASGNKITRLLPNSSTVVY